MFEFLFKYSPIVFTEGRISFNLLPAIVVLVLMAAGFLACLWVIYRRTTLAINLRFKSILIGLKFIALGILLLLVFEPIVTVSTVVPRKSSIIVMVDDSKSMSIRDVADKRSRKDFVQELLGTAERPGLLDDLKKNFKLQLYRFSSDVEHLKDAAELSAGGAATDLATGLSFADELSRRNMVSGVVILTDGVNNGNGDPLQAAALLKNKNVPVFMVGIGSETTRDIELAKVSVNHSVIENSVVELSALIKNRNFGDRTVELELRENGSIVKKQMVALKGTATRALLKFSPQQKGFVRYTLNVLADSKEAIQANNSKSFIIDNRNRKARILYIEGYPRAELKFLRRAVDQDPSVDLVSLLRTGPDKFYRQGIRNQRELQEGYPVARQDLFEYDAIIFGSVEREFFTDSQLEATADFVSQRGGGFMMLGGSLAFAQGGYSGSVIEKVLPVELPYQNGAARSVAATFRDKYKLLLTHDGYRSPVLQLAADDAENRAIWDSLPDLEGYNPLGRAKPGATILAVHPLSEPSNPKIIIAQQRFGRGRSMVLATSSTWHWQMGLPHEDLSHERFWRQVLRWLALSSPRPIEAGTDRKTYIPNEQVTLKVDVRDSSFTTIDDASIKARIRKPSGATVEVPFRWSSNGKVEYHAAYHPDEEGMYLVEVNAYSADGKFLGKSETAFFVEESRAEFSNAHLQSSFLKRIAEIGGGKYYYQGEAKRLPDEISVMQGSFSKLVEYDLWDMPVFFLLVIMLVCIEWYLRRSKGLS
ncbi:VWA domain-containing protein [candidate division KSB1 bacterium]|nr:VWA domain-containing protein [candidate division KSB1 bacterium]